MAYLLLYSHLISQPQYKLVFLHSKELADLNDTIRKSAVIQTKENILYTEKMFGVGFTLDHFSLRNG